MTLKRFGALLVAVCLLFVLSGCIVAAGETHCVGGHSRWRWTLTNTGDPVDDFTVDAVTLVPNGAGTGGPFFFVGQTVEPGASLTHLEYQSDDASEELTVVGHYVSAPTQPVTIKKSAVNGCP